jgi:enoyl-CoA hydratase/carnithine racemase
VRYLVLRTDDEGIASLTLNRPDALNALSPNLYMELREHLEIINAQSEQTGCVIFRGAG